MDAKIRNIQTRQVQADEIWSFVYCKEREVTEEMNREIVGDQWTYVAIDRDTKLVISFYVGKRTFGNTQTFTDDLSNRLDSRVQLSTDGYLGYKDTVDASFGGAIDYGQVVKIYETRDGQRGRFGVPECIAAIPTTILGNPDQAKICTSHVERSNLSMRTFMRRLTRLCLGFSKKLENLKHAVALYFAWYNFVRVHGTLKVTPAMEAGLTDHVWSLSEMLLINELPS